jgi:hypothetical protein
MSRKIGQELAHVMLRHEQGDISEEIYNNFEDHYLKNAMYHTSVIDPDAVRRELKMFAEDGRLEAMADVWDAKAELGVNELPSYEKPIDASGINIDNLLHVNLDLSNRVQEQEEQIRHQDERIIALEKQLQRQEALSQYAVSESRRLGTENEGLRNQLGDRQAQSMHAHIGWTE